MKKSAVGSPPIAIGEVAVVWACARAWDWKQTYTYSNSHSIRPDASGCGTCQIEGKIKGLVLSCIW